VNKAAGHDVEIHETTAYVGTGRSTRSHKSSGSEHGALLIGVRRAELMLAQQLGIYIHQESIRIQRGCINVTAQSCDGLHGIRGGTGVQPRDLLQFHDAIERETPFARQPQQSVRYGFIQIAAAGDLLQRRYGFRRIIRFREAFAHTAERPRAGRRVQRTRLNPACDQLDQSMPFTEDHVSIRRGDANSGVCEYCQRLKFLMLQAGKFCEIREQNSPL
jgi:hypothetical protein